MSFYKSCVGEFVYLLSLFMLAMFQVIPIWLATLFMFLWPLYTPEDETGTTIIVRLFILISAALLIVTIYAGYNNQPIH